MEDFKPIGEMKLMTEAEVLKKWAGHQEVFDAIKDLKIKGVEYVWCDKLKTPCFKGNTAIRHVFHQTDLNLLIGEFLGKGSFTLKEMVEFYIASGVDLEYFGEVYLSWKQHLS